MSSWKRKVNEVICLDTRLEGGGFGDKKMGLFLFQKFPKLIRKVRAVFTRRYDAKDRPRNENRCPK